jgi:hypothetical protein
MLFSGPWGMMIHEKTWNKKSPDTVPLILVADIAANIWWLPLEAWDHQSCQHVATTSPHKTDHSSTSGLSIKCMGTTVQIIIHFCEFKGTAAQDFSTHWNFWNNYFKGLLLNFPPICEVNQNKLSEGKLSYYSCVQKFKDFIQSFLL